MLGNSFLHKLQNIILPFIYKRLCELHGHWNMQKVSPMQGCTYIHAYMQHVRIQIWICSIYEYTHHMKIGSQQPTYMLDISNIDQYSKVG